MRAAHALAALLGSVAAAGAAHAAGPDCAALAGKTGDVVVDRATEVRPAPAWQVAATGSYAPVPVTVAFCRVEGHIEGTIGFEAWLPVIQRWNGRLLGAGVGGDAGVFNYRDMSLRLNEGFATVSTDSGHKASNPHWMLDAKARRDYEERATHLTTLATKALVQRLYGRAASKAYFLGCSGGGRQGLKEMQNFPADYDGIVAGAPGPYMPLISVRMMWTALLQKAEPAAALSDADWKLYESAVLKACDGHDGVTDGIVEDPRACKFDTATLGCRQGAAADCLSAPKLAMLERIIRPMPDERGQPMDGGLLPGVRPRPGPPSPLLREMWADAVYAEPNWNEDTFRRTADLAAINRVMPELRADKVAIAPFVRRGGKAIIYQGWQDPSVIAQPTVDYYRRLAAANGGTADLQRAVRLFMVPGMYHCRGGSGADAFGGSGQTSYPADPARDILWATIDWVERGRVPSSLVATRPASSGLPAVTRRLCSYQAQATLADPRRSVSAEAFHCTEAPAS